MNALCNWLSVHGTSCVETAGALILVVNVYLVTRENIWNWPVAVVGTAFYVVVFLGQRLYSDTGLQVVYIVLSLYGWYHWLYGAKDRRELPVTRTSRSLATKLLAAGVITWIVLYNITRLIPGSVLPAFDSLLVAISLVAQWMMTRKLLESWALWILVDVFYVGMFHFKGLNVTALLYLIFLGLAVLGHIEWTRSSRRVSHALS